MGRSLNQKETTVLKNTIRRLSKMCDSPTLYVGHTNAIEWAMLMLEDALNGNQVHLHAFGKAISLETALKWDQAEEVIRGLDARKKEIHEAVSKGEFQ